MTEGERVIVVAPDLLFPTNAGGRAAVLAHCAALRRSGRAIDLVVFHREPLDDDIRARHASLATRTVFVRRRGLLDASVGRPLQPYQLSSRVLSRRSAARIAARLRAAGPTAVIAEQEWSTA